MASTVLRTPTTLAPSTLNSLNKSNPSNNIFFTLSFPTTPSTLRCRIFRHSPTLNPCTKLPHRLLKFLPFSINGEASAETTVQTDDVDVHQNQESQEEENFATAVDVEGATSESDSTYAEEHGSIILNSLQQYKEALANNDEKKCAEIEGFFKSIEDEKKELEQKVAALSEEISSERERVLRISADFDNFRKRTERERLSVVTNAQGEIVETLLQVLDNFERAKSQIKIENEGEEKISKSYQSIYKQFVEILGSLGVLPVETVGKPFDPMLHEAIMREDSTLFEEGVVIEEYRKGFQLGDRLLRPSMVKVSSGPGPTKPETVDPSEGQAEAYETSKEANAGSDSTEQ